MDNVGRHRGRPIDFLFSKGCILSFDARRGYPQSGIRAKRFSGEIQLL